MTPLVPYHFKAISYRTQYALARDNLLWRDYRNDENNPLEKYRSVLYFLHEELIGRRW